MEKEIEKLLAVIDDSTREGLLETPARVKRFYESYITKGEPNFKCTVFDSEGLDEMIVQKDISFYSLCEHHMLPFFGTAAIAYIPNGKILGLSKLARVVDWYSRRLQNQERLTQQIANFIDKTVNSLGVAVVLTGRHMCMEMRGIKAMGTSTTTSCLLKNMRHTETRSEFLNLLRG